jgi:heptosyltransferase-3
MLMSAPNRVLVVCTRRIGDVLLTTPLIRSCRRAWPHAQLDALVFRGTEGVLEGNPDVSQVIFVPERSRWSARLVELRGLWRRYDLALSVIPSDRARIYGWSAGRVHYGCREVGASPVGRWLAHKDALYDDLDTHTVSTGLSLADLAGIARCPQVVAPTAGEVSEFAFERSCAVLHPYPKFNYKMWNEAGWIELARHLLSIDVPVFLTGGPESDEMALCERIAAASGARSGAGQLSLAQTADLLRKAALFVGPDTAVTHLAAALGTPTVALFGPSNPVKWGPWPADWSAIGSPWQRIGSQRRGNVYLLQGESPCVPCLQEGCERHVNSTSLCLQQLSAERVIPAALEMLRSGRII